MEIVPRIAPIYWHFDVRLRAIADIWGGYHEHVHAGGAKGFELKNINDFDV